MKDLSTPGNRPEANRLQEPPRRSQDHADDTPCREQTTPPLVLAFGHHLRCDDGFGPRVLDALENETLPAKSPSLVADYRHFIGDVLGLVDLWQGRVVILVDALLSRKPEDVGCLEIMDVSPERAHEIARRGGFSSHMPHLADALSLSESLGCSPKSLSLIGVYAGSFGYGDEMTDAVREAIPKAAQTIRRLLKEISHA